MVVVLLIVLLLMLVASFLANDAPASFDERRLPPARSGVKFRRGQPLGRARSSGGFARRANFNDREAARSCCEPSRGLDAVERRWSLTRLRVSISGAIRVAERADGGSRNAGAPTPRTNPL